MPGTEGKEPEPPKASDKPTGTCFHDLPAELRNTIYELAFEGPLDCCFPEPSKDNKKGRTKCPALLMASKQVHKEAVMMFYSKATFRFDSRAKMTTWLRKIGAKKRNILRKVVCEEPAHKYNHTKLMEYRVMLERGLRDRGVGLKQEVLRTRADDDPDTRSALLPSFTAASTRQATMASPKSSKATSKSFSSVSGPEQPQHASRLLRLPAELRNRIYGLVVKDVVPYRARKTTLYRKIHRVKAAAPGLLLACKQTHFEAIQLFYTQATFLFDDVKHLDTWARKVGNDRTSIVNSIRLSSPRPSSSTMANSFWEPRSALWLYSMEASTRLINVRRELPRSLKHCKVYTDVYLPGSPDIKVAWTRQPVMLMEGFLEDADKKMLDLTHQAFLMLSNERNKVW